MNIFKKLLKSIVFQALVLVMLVWAVTFAATSWPENVPQGETNWWAFKEYFDKIFNNSCNDWYVMLWYKTDKTRNCIQLDSFTKITQMSSDINTNKDNISWLTTRTQTLETKTWWTMQNWKYCKYVSWKITCTDDDPNLDVPICGPITWTNFDTFWGPWFHINSYSESQLCASWTLGRTIWVTSGIGWWTCVSWNLVATCIISEISSDWWYSDSRLKDDINPLLNALDAVEQLQWVTFDWKWTWNPDIWFIAQEVMEVLPELVHMNEDTWYYQVSYQWIIPLLVEALKEQEEKYQSDISRLEQEIEEIKNNLK